MCRLAAMLYYSFAVCVLLSVVIDVFSVGLGAFFFLIDLKG